MVIQNSHTCKPDQLLTCLDSDWTVPLNHFNLSPSMVFNVGSTIVRHPIWQYVVTAFVSMCLKHCDVLRSAVHMSGRAASSWRFQTLAASQGTCLDVISDHDAGPMREVPLEAGHHSLSCDRAELVGESPIEHEDDYSEDPLTDGRCML